MKRATDSSSSIRSSRRRVPGCRSSGRTVGSGRSGSVMARRPAHAQSLDSGADEAPLPRTELLDAELVAPERLVEPDFPALHRLDHLRLAAGDPAARAGGRKVGLGGALGESRAEGVAAIGHVGLLCFAPAPADSAPAKVKKV